LPLPKNSSRNLVYKRHRLVLLKSCPPSQCIGMSSYIWDITKYTMVGK
jgi:hypothetical protein